MTTKDLVHIATKCRNLLKLKLDLPRHCAANVTDDVWAALTRHASQSLQVLELSNQLHFSCAAAQNFCETATRLERFDISENCTPFPWTFLHCVRFRSEVIRHFAVTLDCRYEKPVALVHIAKLKSRFPQLKTFRYKTVEKTWMAMLASVNWAAVAACACAVLGVLTVCICTSLLFYLAVSRSVEWLQTHHSGILIFLNLLNCAIL